jgi:hypothetical protein
MCVLLALQSYAEKQLQAWQEVKRVANIVS